MLIYYLIVVQINKVLFFFYFFFMSDVGAKSRPQIKKVHYYE